MERTEVDLSVPFDHCGNLFRTQLNWNLIIPAEARVLISGPDATVTLQVTTDITLNKSPNKQVKII